MPAGRFYIAGVPWRPGLELDLPDAVARQTRDVLRLRPGDALRLLDGAGGEYPAEIVAVERRRVAVRLGERREGAAEPPVRVVLCQGMLKADKLEWVLQKGTELGVAAFVPLLTERAVAAADSMGEARRRRWVRILAEAMEQCGGTVLPDLATPRPLMHALTSLPSGALALIPWEEERGTTLRGAVETARAANPTLREVQLFIGPEGGFSAGEVALARRHGAVPVTLGARILRAETAAVVAVTLVLDAFDALRVAPKAGAQGRTA